MIVIHILSSIVSPVIVMSYLITGMYGSYRRGTRQRAVLLRFHRELRPFVVPLVVTDAAWWRIQHPGSLWFWVWLVIPSGWAWVIWRDAKNDDDDDDDPWRKRGRNVKSLMTLKRLVPARSST